jgi:hypothetical protein
MRRFLFFLFSVVILFVVGGGIWWLKTQPMPDIIVDTEKITDDKNSMSDSPNEVIHNPLPEGSYKRYSTIDNNNPYHVTAFVRGYVTQEEEPAYWSESCYDDENLAILNPEKPGCIKYNHVFLHIVDVGTIPNLDRSYLDFDEPVGPSFESGSKIHLGCLENGIINFLSAKINKYEPDIQDVDEINGSRSPQLSTALLSSTPNKLVTLQVTGDVYPPPYGVGECYTFFHTVELYSNGSN